MRVFVPMIPGLLWVVLLAVLSVLLARMWSVSETLIAIFLGFVVNHLWRQPATLKPGIQWSECHGLSIAVALLGLQLNAFILMQINLTTLLFMIGALMFTWMVTWLMAQWLKFDSKPACLLASGQAICGSAAILATQNIIKAPAAQVGLMVALVNFLGFLGIFVTAWLVQYLPLDGASDAGFLIGNTLQSMGHVVAAAFAHGDATGHSAVLIKMGRILLLIPVLLLLILVMKSSTQTAHSATMIKRRWYGINLIPWFIWVFLMFSFLASMNWVPGSIQYHLGLVSDALFVMAMVAIGLNIHLKEVWQQGGRWLLLGLIVFTLQMVFTLVGLLYF